jgi:hypothetical protein
MLNSGGEADGARADVYSLAKVLWVLLAGQRYPIPGEIRAMSEVCASRYVPDERAIFLDRLIESCTSNDPAKRPRMQRMADELSAVILTSPEVAAPPSLDHLVERFQQIAKSSADTQQQAQLERTQEELLMDRLKDFLEELAQDVRRIVSPQRIEVLGRTNEILRYSPLKAANNCAMRLHVTTTKADTLAHLLCGFALAWKDDNCKLFGAYVVFTTDIAVRKPFEKLVEFPRMTAQQDVEVGRLVNELREGLPDALSLLADAAGDPEAFQSTPVGPIASSGGRAHSR